MAFAAVAGRHLVAQLVHNGYAKEVGGKTGFVAAFALDDGRLAWCSDPLTGNSESFATMGGYLMTGYGFTAEPDRLMVLELATGRVVEKIPIRSRAAYVIAARSRVFVRTYDRDLIFRVFPALEPPALAALPEAPPESWRPSIPTAAAGSSPPSPPSTRATRPRCALPREASRPSAARMRSPASSSRSSALWRRRRSRVGHGEGSKGSLPLLRAPSRCEATERRPRRPPPARSSRRSVLLTRRARMGAVD